MGNALTSLALALLLLGCDRSLDPGTGGGSAPAATPAWDMLAALDKHVMVQEDTKDVRCWSSVSRLQMLLAGTELDTEARNARVEQHQILIESIWKDSRATSNVELIAAHAVEDVLKRRFPRQVAEDGTVQFAPRGYPGITVSPDDLKDYSDTIEPWRLLQSWALTHVHQGRLALSPQFAPAALDTLHEFLLVYDVAVLRHANAEAFRQKKQGIDRSAMVAGFRLERLL